MSAPIEANVNSRTRSRSAKSTAKPSKKSYLFFFTSWILLIATGVLGTMLYTDYLKQQLSAELASQTEQQLQLMQAKYQEQLEQLKTEVAADLGALQTKVDTFNELLAFTRDSANNRTDNSNQLYTQLQEVKKKTGRTSEKLGCAEMTVRELNRFFLLVCGPFIGMLIWLGINGFTIRMPELNTSSLELFSVSGQAASIIQNLDIAQQNAIITRGTIETYYQLYEKSASEASAMLAIAAAQVARPHLIFENRVNAVLGRPIRTVSSGNIDLRLYSFKDPNYQGYALKVNLKNGNAMKMVWAKTKSAGRKQRLRRRNGTARWQG